MKIVITYLLALTLFLAMDLVWLGYVAKDFYLSRMGAIMLDRPKMGIAVLFYTVYVIGLMVFVIMPALLDGNWQTAALNGALFGFFITLIPIRQGLQASQDLTSIPVAVLNGMVMVFVSIVVIEVLSSIIRFI